MASVNVDDEIVFNVSKLTTPTSRKSLGPLSQLDLNATPPVGCNSPVVVTVSKDPSGKAATSLSWGLVGSPYPPAKQADNGVSPQMVKAWGSSLLSPTPVKRAVDSANSVLSEISQAMGLAMSPVPPTSTTKAAGTILAGLMPEVTMESLESLDIDSIISLESKEVRLSVGSPMRPSSSMETKAASIPTPVPVSVAHEGEGSSSTDPTADQTAASQMSMDASPAKDTAMPPVETEETASTAVSSVMAISASPAPAPAPEAGRPNASRRESMGLAMKGEYESKIHEPRYSQAEMDAITEQLKTATERGNADAAAAVALADIRATLNDTTLQLAAAKAAMATAQADAAADRQAAAAAKEESILFKAQTKALSHRLAHIDAEAAQALAAAKLEAESLAKAMSEMRTRHSEALVEHRALTIRAANEEREAAEAALRSELQSLGEQLSAMRAKMVEADASLPAQLAQAESRGKQHVYKKVEKQFEEGNREFVKVKKELSERLAEHGKVLGGLLVGLSGALGVPLTAGAGTGAVAPSEAQAEGERLCALVATQRTELDTAQTAAVASASASASALASVQQQLDTSAAVHSQALAEAKDTMRCTIVSLEMSLQKTESELRTQVECLAEAKATLIATRAELAETRTERDGQMNAMAKMLSEHACLEGSVEALKREVADKEERCVQLRQVNEEVMGMLEKLMAEGQGQGQGLSGPSA